MGKKLIILVLALLSADLAAAKADTVSVYFPFNESLLNVQAKLHLDSAIYKGTIPPTARLQIIGYTDAVGSDTFNLRLSRQRAASVKGYLIESGFKAEDITLIMGKGEAFATVGERPGGNLADRRVDIVRALSPPRPHPGNSFVKVKSVPGGTSSSSTGIPINPPGGSQKASAIDISTVRVGESVVLDNIYFYPGKHIVRKESDESLNALAETLSTHTGIKIRIEGHVCCVPVSANDAVDDETGHEELSINRAIAIRDYLISHGIAKERLSVIGFGHRHPVITLSAAKKTPIRTGGLKSGLCSKGMPFNAPFHVLPGVHS